MVEYSCPKCCKLFYKKTEYIRHMNKIYDCSSKKKLNRKKKPIIFKCDGCEKGFKRKDHMKNHLKICKKYIEKQNNNNHAQVGRDLINADLINNGNYYKDPIFIQNYINIVPFGKDGTDSFSLADTYKIFTSKTNPIEVIILKSNLDPRKPQHHNIGISDHHSGFGMIFDGKIWKKERISIIMETLMNSKEKDLRQLYDEIKDYLTDDSDDIIQRTLEKIDNVIRPTSMFGTKSKKNLSVHLKKHFCNSKEIMSMAQNNNPDYYSDNDITSDECKGFFKNGLTFEEVEHKFNLRKEKHKMKKDFVRYLITRSIENKCLSHKDGNEILECLDDIPRPEMLKPIIDELTKSAYFGSKTSFGKINQRMVRDNEIMNFIRNY